ncbi:hypothetical protein [Aliivibrio fischeri]|uniref:hypothetical protein n=1 Tax=Aliivibrio fischeri TaxID=668 RepID=UPI00080E5C69|nr:hypothetical protein [Aliivibrio fischeri]OCH05844.1 hypothetical protein A6E10_07200 [Aliivibrio fischeri]
MFFQSELNLKDINGFMNRTEHLSLPDEKSKIRLEYCREIIASIKRNPEEWDMRCSFNIKHIGDRFIDNLHDFSVSDDLDKINDIYTKSFRFLCEFDFLAGTGREFDSDLYSVKSAIINEALVDDSEIKSKIIYAAYLMPASILKDHLNNKNITNVTDFQSKLDQAEQLKLKWDEELKVKQDEIKVLDEKLDKIKTGFNFVGLYKGFHDLAKKKETELKWLFFSLILMSIFILTPLIYEFLMYSRYDESKEFQISVLLKLIPLVSIELILIYFFRIILMNYRSTKAQIMQIELRQTLCQFIQSYADYASDIKTKDSSSLEKFENLIFSGILSDAEKLPSTFDGLEQISSMLKSLKGS